MPPLEFEPATSKDERPQTHVLDRAVMYTYLNMQILIPIL